jgi:hypothetical protein
MIAGASVASPIIHIAAESSIHIAGIRKGANDRKRSSEKSGKIARPKGRGDQRLYRAKPGLTYGKLDKKVREKRRRKSPLERKLSPQVARRKGPPVAPAAPPRSVSALFSGPGPAFRSSSRPRHRGPFSSPCSPPNFEDVPVEKIVCAPGDRAAKAVSGLFPCHARSMVALHRLF